MDKIKKGVESKYLLSGTKKSISNFRETNPLTSLLVPLLDEWSLMALLVRLRNIGVGWRCPGYPHIKLVLLLLISAGSKLFSSTGTGTGTRP
jgi:hypothetical protein